MTATAVIDGRPGLLHGSLRQRLQRAANDAGWAAQYAAQGAQWAREADRAHRVSAEMHPHRRPLVRVGVKDNVHCAPFATRHGTRRFREYPQRSAAAINGQVSASVICKTQLTELTLGRDAGVIHRDGPSRWAGASSTGSAVAVATGICDLALGTDSLGSVRIPAIANNVVGLRLTHDPDLLDGVLPISPTFDAIGWFARTADDLDCALDYFGIVPPRSGSCMTRVAVATEIFDDPACAPRIRSGYDMFARQAERLGIEIIEIRLGSVWEYRLASWQLCAFEAAANLDSRAVDLGPLGADVESVLDAGRRLPSDEMRALKDDLAQMRADMDARLRASGADCVAMPAYPFELPTPQELSKWPMLFPDISDRHANQLAGYAPIASVLGWPVVTTPDSDGTGMQLMGPRYTERALLALAARIAAEEQRRPL
ncbi:MAG: amidase family protein [Segniliparus sp.]|uniref:amidase family protein n=1 Tax=Segniliparus sp. TaxID=2804064 RepID=UPI003F341670